MDWKKLRALRADTPESILGLLESGEITPAEACFLFQELGRKTVTPGDGEISQGDRLEEALAELNSLIGLESVKKLVREIGAFVEIQKRRSVEKLATEPLVLHMVFRGNPGTGKTTVARILGKVFRTAGVLPKGHLVEVERADLVGEYVGHTAQKTRDQIRRALGGILFIDEAYSLARGGERDFGKEAIDTLVKAMEDHKDELVVILAGYRVEMQMFLQSNPGLRSRFPIHIDFPDYTLDELLSIADLMVRKRQYRLTDEARREVVRLLLNSASAPLDNFSNARVVRNLIERAIRKQALRLVSRRDLTRDDLMLIEREDLEEVWPSP